MRKVVYGLGALGLLLFSGLFSLLPRAWAHWIGRRLGGIAYYLSPRSRRTALENVRQRLGADGAAARRIATRSVGLAGCSIVDMLRAPRMSDRVLERDLVIDPQAPLDELRRGDRGAVVAIAHAGSWELLFLAGPFLARRRSLIVVRPPPYPLVARVLRWLRSRTGQTVIYRRGAVARSLEFVQGGGVAWLMVDVNVPPQSALRVPFFGLPTCTTFAPAHVARTAGVPLYFGCLLPDRGSRYRFFLERIEPGDDLAVTERISGALERRIRSCPDGWAWWSKRWNVRPADVREGWPSYSKDERRYLPEGKVRPDPEA
jgi:KDO2-lipid IV(A) lauroyltransferase